MPHPPQAPDLDWRDGAVPVSRHFDDPYFSLGGGLEETRHVFLAGNRLPDRFCDGFHIAELGFGTGLNLLALCLLQPAQPIRFTSFEAFPLSADEIARACVPVITLGMQNRPDSFEDVGATMSNVGRLAAAGVKVALGVPDLDASFQPRNLPHYAGNMVAQGRLPGGSGLTWDQAFASISKTPAEIFGLSSMGVLKQGASGDVVVWSGDPLELGTHADAVLIRGVPQSLESRQTQLARRYKPGRDRTQLPEAYNR